MSDNPETLYLDSFSYNQSVHEDRNVRATDSKTVGFDIEYIRADIVEKDKQELRDVINGLVELCELLDGKLTAKDLINDRI